MPKRPPLYKPYQQRKRKAWDRGLQRQDRLTGRALQQRNRRIKIRDQFTCQNQLCGLVTTELEVDHRIPIAAGGSDTEDNQRCLCVSCHSVKSRIESKGKLLPDPDRFPLSYALAKRSLLLEAPWDSCDDDAENDYRHGIKQTRNENGSHYAGVNAANENDSDLLPPGGSHQ